MQTGTAIDYLFGQKMETVPTCHINLVEEEIAAIEKPEDSRFYYESIQSGSRKRTFVSYPVYKPDSKFVYTMSLYMLQIT